MTNRTAGVGGVVRGVGDWSDFFGEALQAGTTIGQTVLTGNAPGGTAAPAPGPVAAPAAKKDNTLLWVGVAGLGAVLLFSVMKRRGR